MKIVKQNLGKINSENGFYIGDPCFVLSDNDYSYLTNQSFDFRGGLIETTNGNFLVHSTLVGDGEYDSEVGSLSVESGQIAIIPKSMIDYSEISDEIINEYGTIVPGTEAEAIWYEADKDEVEEFYNSFGNLKIIINNPELDFKVVTGTVDVDEFGEPIKKKIIKR
jgi:homogentisate 1,2-dioxygenase